jgi:hypothetical protein
MKETRPCSSEDKGVERKERTEVRGESGESREQGGESREQRGAGTFVRACASFLEEEESCAMFLVRVGAPSVSMWEVKACDSCSSKAHSSGMAAITSACPLRDCAWPLTVRADPCRHDNELWCICVLYSHALGSCTSQDCIEPR